MTRFAVLALFLIACGDDPEPDIVDHRPQPVLLSKDDMCVLISTLTCETVIDECGFVGESGRGQCQAIGQDICLSNSDDPRMFWQNCRTELYRLTCEEIDTNANWWYELCTNDY